MSHQFFEFLLLDDWEHRTVTFNSVQKGHWTREGCTERPNPCSYCSQAVITTCSPFIMLESDMALKNDPAFLLLVHEYANDQAQWQSDFSTSWKQLTEAGLPKGCSRIEDGRTSPLAEDENTSPLASIIICGAVVSLALCGCVRGRKQSEVILAKCVQKPEPEPEPGHVDGPVVQGEPLEEAHIILDVHAKPVEEQIEDLDKEITDLGAKRSQFILDGAPTWTIEKEIGELEAKKNTLRLTQKLERRKETRKRFALEGQPAEGLVLLDDEIRQLEAEILLHSGGEQGATPRTSGGAVVAAATPSIPTLRRRLSDRQDTKRLLESEGEQTGELDLEIAQLMSMIERAEAAGPAAASPAEPVAAILCEGVPPPYDPYSVRP
eukprot:COSAG06_NODE_275_length_18581_cov_31.316145_10_plen_379_part_00